MHSCTKCGQDKPDTDFYWTSGRRAQPCKPCAREQQRARDRAGSTPDVAALVALLPHAAPAETRAVLALQRHGNVPDAAAELGISGRAFRAHLRALERRGTAPPAPAPAPPPEAPHVFVSRHPWPSVAEFDAEQRAALRAAPEAPAAPPVTREEQLEVVEEHRLRRRVRELEAQAKSLIADLSDARHVNDIAREAAQHVVEPVVVREPRSGLREGTPLVLASDWHFEEEVRPEQVAGRNRFNLEIARARAVRFFQSMRWSIDWHRQVFKIRDCVLWLGGDLLTNYLHDDNVESNLLSPVEAIAELQTAIGAGLRYLLEDPEIERFVVPMNDGNHGRLTDRTRAATRVENSLEWLLYVNLAREFAHEPRLQFQLPAGLLTHLEIYGRTTRFTHGDAVKYAGGIGGITIPIFKALAGWETLRRADLTCMGHWHQMYNVPGLIVNGSLIGMSAYSVAIKARHEPPQQAFCMLDSRRFQTTSVPLHVSERSDDELAP